jgi:hypothetical protein
VSTAVRGRPGGRNTRVQGSFSDPEKLLGGLVTRATLDSRTGHKPTYMYTATFHFCYPLCSAVCTCLKFPSPWPCSRRWGRLTLCVTNRGHSHGLLPGWGDGDACIDLYDTWDAMLHALGPALCPVVYPWCSLPPRRELPTHTAVKGGRGHYSTTRS